MAHLTEMAHRLRCLFHGFDPETTSTTCPNHLGGQQWLAVEAEVKRMLKDGEAKFVRICLTPDYVVPADDADMIEDAKTSLIEDVCNAVKMDEIGTWVGTRPAWFGSEGDVPSFLLEGREEDED